MSVRQSGCQLIKYSGRLSQFNLSVEQILSQSLVVTDFGCSISSIFIIGGFESNHKSFGKPLTEAIIRSVEATVKSCGSNFDGLAEATVKVCGSNCKGLRK